MAKIGKEGAEALREVLKNAITTDAKGGLTINGQKVEAGEVDLYLITTATSVDKTVAEKAKEYVEAAGHKEVVIGTLNTLRNHGIIKP